jgi:hypothetical protein
VQVFDDAEHRVLCCQRQHQAQQGFQGLLTLALRRQAERRIAVGPRQREEGSQQGDRVLQVEVRARQGGFELAHLVVGRILCGKRQRPLQQLDHRIESAMLMIGGPAALQARMGRCGDMGFQHLHQP